MKYSPRTLFMFLCLPFRIILAVIGYYIYRNKNLQYLSKPFGVILGLISVSFFVLYFTNGRMNAPEAGPQGTWWAPFRIIHGFMYLIAGIYALRGQLEYTWIPLAIDVLIGLSLSMWHYSSPVK